MTVGVESEATAEKEAAVDATRQRVATEVEEIVQRFTPAVVKQRLEARLLEKLERLILLARRRPAVVVGFGAAVACLALWQWRRKAG